MLRSAGEGFKLLLTIGAGTGLIYLLRWFWWRINAWSEIAAMAASFALSLGMFIARKQGAAISDHRALLVTVALTSLVWIGVTLLTRPASRETLVNFYKLVRPAGPGWRGIREEAGVGTSPDSIAQALLGWMLGCVLVYSALFGTGCFIYGNLLAGGVLSALFAASAIGLTVLLSSMLSGAREER